MQESILQSCLINVLDILYPRRCAVCGDIVTPRGALVHSACAEKPKIVSEPCCRKCGAPVSGDDAEYCANCTSNEFLFREGTALFVYDDIMRKSVADFKFLGHRQNADYYIKCMTACMGRKLERWAPDAFIPVPVHRSKKRDRGYNQAELLADGLGKYLNVPVVTDLLLRGRKTAPQKELSAAERLKNLKDAFYINKRAAARYRLNTVVLVDDIYTTGSTMEACTEMLLQNGVSNVYFAVLCTAPGYTYE